MKQYKSIAIINTKDGKDFGKGLVFNDDTLVIRVPIEYPPFKVKPILDAYNGVFREIRKADVYIQYDSDFNKSLGLKRINTFSNPLLKIVLSHLKILNKKFTEHYDVTVQSLDIHDLANTRPYYRDFRLCSYVGQLRRVRFVKDRQMYDDLRQQEIELYGYARTQFINFKNSGAILTHVYNLLSLNLIYDIEFDFVPEEELLQRLKYIVGTCALVGSQLIVEGKVVVTSKQLAAVTFLYDKKDILIAVPEILEETKNFSSNSNYYKLGSAHLVKLPYVDNKDFFNVARIILHSNNFSSIVICTDGIKIEDLEKLRTMMTYLLGYSSRIQFLNYDRSRDGDLVIEETLINKNPGEYIAVPDHSPIALSAWLHSEQTEVYKTQDD